MIQYIKDDLLSLQRGMILHGTNCGGAFGSGIAGAIRRKWPHVYDVFMKSLPGAHLLGTIVPVPINDDVTVVNCYTQLNFGGDGAVYASADAVELCFAQAYAYAAVKKTVTIAVPKIGCGLGGLVWETDVEPLLNAVAAKYPDITTIVYYID